MDQLPLYNYLKIPSLNQQKVQSTLIGVIDASGSMSSIWPHIAKLWNITTEQQQNSYTITFSESSKLLIRNEKLSTRVQDHGGGMTNITSGFESLNTIIKTNPDVSKNITIIFISDGDDNSTSDKNNTLEQRLEKIYNEFIKYNKKINFITIGIGSSFPTFLAMKLRTMYHNADQNVPPVFLVTQNTLEALQEQFNILSPYFSHNERYQIQPAILEFPWSDKRSNEVHENQWVLVDGNIQELIVNKSVVMVQDKMNIVDIINMIKFWLSEIQLKSIQNKVDKFDVKQKAQMSLKVIEELRERFVNPKPKNQQEKQTFHQRLLNRSHNQQVIDLNIIVKELKAYAEDTLLSKLTEAEAAKRLAIGTQVGKYHSVAMKLKGLSVDQFKEILEEFLKRIKNCKLNQVSNQEPSAIIMQNQKDVFLEKDLQDGLQLCGSQYDLIENMPLVGHSLMLRRSDGAQINPWLIEVTNIAKFHKVLDSVSIQQTGKNMIELNTGDGDKEQINAVLPLFNETDFDLKPLITSKLYHILMTFNVMQNADTLYQTAYVALQASTLLYLFGQQDSEWKSNLIDTFKLTFSESTGFKQYMQTLMDTPNLAMVTEHPDITSKCESLTKPFITLFYLITENRLNPITDTLKIADIIEKMIIELLGRNLPADEKVSSFFEIANKEVLKQFDFSPLVNPIIDEFKNKFNEYYTVYEMKSAITQKTMDLNVEVKKDVQIDVQFNEEKLYKTRKTAINQLEIFEKMYEIYVKKPIDKSKYVIWLNHAVTYSNSYERNTKQMSTNIEEIMQKVKNEKCQQIFDKNEIFNQIWNVLHKMYNEYMTKIHYLVLPLTMSDLKKYCSKHKQDYTQYQFNQCSNLLRNACMAVNCPFFMKVSKSLSTHLESYTQQLPALHKTIRICSNKTDQEIFQHIINGDYLEPTYDVHVIIENLKKRSMEDKDIIIDVIKQSKDYYIKNKL